MRSAGSEATAAAVAGGMRSGAESTKPETRMAASTKRFCARARSKSSQGTDSGGEAFVTGPKFFQELRCTPRTLWNAHSSLRQA
jgi:hypothetical protein